MKKIALISLAAIAALASCQKEEFVNESQAGNSPVFTASIATDETKTTLSDDSPAKILWESTDKITITDASSHTAVYTLSAGEGTKSGTFIYESGTALDPSSSYTATYGAAPSTYQVYSSAGSVPLYMTASASSTNDLVFTAQCGVLRVTLTDASHDIMRVEVSDGTNTYKVTSTFAVDASPAKFYLALPAGTYTSLNIYDDNFQMVSKTGIELAVTAGHVKPAVSSSLSFTDCTTKGFRGTHAVVQLWAGDPFWAENNIGAETPEAYGQYFAWGYTEGCVRNSAGDGWVLASDGSTAKQFNATNFTHRETAAYEDAATANWGTGWSVPTKTDLDNLISSSNTSIEYVTTETPGIRVTGKGDYVSNSIFLPAAGNGLDSYLFIGDSGNYWSSVQNDSDNAYTLRFFPEDDESEVNNFSKHCGYPVRPVYTPAEPVLLSGEFSVSATKKVKFTKGNLYWDGAAWGLEDSQTDYPTAWSTSHVGHFFWTKTAAASYAESYNDGTCTTSDKFFADGSDADHKLSVDGQSGLYALSSAEWTYLLSTRGTGDSYFKKGVTVGTAANCLVIAPDGYSGTIADSYDAAAWATAESNGLVCLPAAGFRNDSDLDSGSVDGYYWSATPDGGVEEYAGLVYFNGSNVEPSNYDYYRSNGNSVRLVCSVSE